MATVDQLKEAQARIENAQHELNDAIRIAGLMKLNTRVKVVDVEDQNGIRDVVFTECSINPNFIELEVIYDT